MTDLNPSATSHLVEHGDRALIAIEWSAVREVLAAPPPPDTPGGHLAAFLVTVRPDGRPHATGVGVRWYDGDLYFLSGPSTRKSRNLAANPACAIAMRLPDGLDLVLDGEAAPIDDSRSSTRSAPDPPGRLAGAGRRRRLHRADHLVRTVCRSVVRRRSRGSPTP